MLSERLGIPYYDQQIREEAKKNLHLSEYDLAEHEESAKHSLLYSIANGMTVSLGAKQKEDISYRLFEEERAIIRHYAKEGSCIIIGRCADTILSDFPDCFHVFIQARMVKRIERIVNRYQVSPAQAREMIVKNDKKRSAFHSKFGRGTWGKREQYHMILDSGEIGIEGVVTVLETFIKCLEE